MHKTNRLKETAITRNTLTLCEETEVLSTCLLGIPSRFTRPKKNCQACELVVFCWIWVFMLYYEDDGAHPQTRG